MDLTNFSTDPEQFPGNEKKSGYIKLRNYIKNNTVDISQEDLKKNMVWINEFLRNGTKSMNTLSTQLKIIKRLLGGGKNEIYKLTIQNNLKLDEQEISEKMSNDAVSLTNRLKNKQIFTGDQISILLQTVRTEPGVYDKIILCQLATGRRSIEIMSNRFPVPEYKNRRLIYKKLAKQKLVADVHCPLLYITYHELIESLIFIHDTLDQKKNNEQFAASYNLTLNRRLEELVPGLRSNGLRRLYASVAKRRKKRGVDSAVAIRDSLRHHPNNLTSQLNYKTSILRGKVKIYPREPTKPMLIPESIEQRMLNIMKSMKASGDMITNKAVKSKGFGSGSVSKFYKINLNKLI